MKAEVTITRVQCSETEDYISIQATCRDPLMSRWSLKVPLADFSMILTARGGVECDLQVRSLLPGRGGSPPDATASASDPRIERVLAELRKVPREQRTAREHEIVLLLGG